MFGKHCHRPFITGPAFCELPRNYYSHMVLVGHIYISKRIRNSSLKCLHYHFQTARCSKSKFSLTAITHNHIKTNVWICITLSPINIKRNCTVHLSLLVKQQVHVKINKITSNIHKILKYISFSNPEHESEETSHILQYCCAEIARRGYYDDD
jgi:hypothetical protein